MSAVTSIILWALLAGQAGRATASATPDLSGVYQPIPDGMTLTGGLKNSGSPADVSLQPAALAKMKETDLKLDPWKLCKPIGPFRMMARPDTKIELVSQPGMLYILFEDLSHGVMRQVYMSRGHKQLESPLWFGNSVGSWQADTLVIDTVGFNGRSWFNDAGAPQSDALHLVERIKPVLRGKYLEYKMTAEDPKNLTKPYTYTRYYEKLKTEIAEFACMEEH
jgi:hypothetical protein